ncbi:MAG: NAD(P)-binding domain-containing protein [Streptosporangiaceae bacterium]
MAIIGFVGLGVMGGTIATRLLDAGHAVQGHNRTTACSPSLRPRPGGGPDDNRTTGKDAMSDG